MYALISRIVSHTAAAHAGPIERVARFAVGILMGILSWMLMACSALPQPPMPQVVYDLGPGTMTHTVQPPQGLPTLPLALEPVQGAGGVGSSTLLHYRLTYADVQHLRSYAQARWSEPPAQLLQQRLMERLGQERAIVQPRDNLKIRLQLSSSSANASLSEVPQASLQSVPILRVVVEEFSHTFTTPDTSYGELRLRATLSTPHSSGEQLHAQQVWTVQERADSADARGGAHALARATDQAAQNLAQWVQEALSQSQNK